MNLKTRFTSYRELVTWLFRRPATVRDTFGFIASASRGLPGRDGILCTGCGACNERCSSGATNITDAGNERTISIDSLRCIFCGRCADVCPEGALDLRAGSVFPEISASVEDDSKNAITGRLCISDKDPDVIRDRYAGFLSFSHGIHEKSVTVDTTLTLQICPVCGKQMQVTEKFLQVISKRVLENLQPDTAEIVKKDMERYLTACISCRRKMSVEWNTHPRKFI